MPQPSFKVTVVLKDESQKLIPLKGKHVDEVRRKAKKLPDVVRVHEVIQIGREEYLALKEANKPPAPLKVEEALLPAIAQPPKNVPGRGVVRPTRFSTLPATFDSHRY